MFLKVILALSLLDLLSFVLSYVHIYNVALVPAYALLKADYYMGLDKCRSMLAILSDDLIATFIQAFLASPYVISVSLGIAQLVPLTF